METQQFNRTDLQRFIDENQIEAEILVMDDHTPTVPDAARALGVTANQIIKSLVFMINREPVLVINNGTAKVDSKKLATYLAVGRKKIKFARPDQALAITGYVVGSMPPFGHKQKLRSLLDPAITEVEVVFGGGGDINAMMRLTSAELQRVIDAEVVEVSE